MPFNFKKEIVIIIAGIGIYGQLFAQHYPANYFRSPLDIELSAAGTFGEPRPNHFHSGLDLKTNGIEGLSVYAVADGYVSRIRVQANGFGKAVYVTHHNGYTSVYGHLSRYNENIGAYLKKMQYKRESFDIDLQLSPTEIVVKKGDVIAFSGNTGNSGGPHLHFELRDTKTEATINPLLFGLSLADKCPPILQYIKLYPKALGSHIDANDEPFKLKLKGKEGEYTLENAEPIRVYGKISFALQAYDTQNDCNNKNGIYSMELGIDGVSYYKFVAEKFLFSESRYVNAYIDFEEQQKSKNVFQQCFLLPNNKFEGCKNLENNEFGGFYDTKIHEIRLTVKDVAGNVSTLNFQVKGDGNRLPGNISAHCAEKFSYNKLNSFKTEEFKISMPQNALFDSLCFDYSVSLPEKGCYSRIHHVGNPFIPVFSSYTISILPINLPEKLRNKALIALYNSKNQAEAQGGGYEDGYITSKVNKFGNYGVVVDTTAPVIKPVNIKKNMKSMRDIHFHIGDNLSGIQVYRLTIDNKWVLAEMDGKTGTLTYVFDEHLSKNKSHHLKLVVTDVKNNSRSYETNFIY